MPTGNEHKIKNVLLTGGAGYIGSALLSKLLACGYNVRLLDVLLFGTEPIDHLINDPKLEVVKADFRDVNEVVTAMQGMDAVIHLGALVGDPACGLDEELTIEVNLKATRMIIEVAKCMGVRRMVFASSCSVYGAGDEILDERSALNPVSLYADSKIAAETVLRHVANNEFSSVILRFGSIYGLSGRTRFDSVINLLTAKALVEDQITVFGGNQWRPFLHVDDAALAMFKALEAPRYLVHNQVFNVGSDEQNHTIQQVAEIIHNLVPNAALLNMESNTDARNYRVSFDKIRRTLGFTPQWTVEQGVKQVMEAINRGQVNDYRDAKYSNVKFLKTEGLTRFFANRGEWKYDLINETIARISDDQKLEADENTWAHGLITNSNNVQPKVAVIQQWSTSRYARLLSFRPTIKFHITDHDEQIYTFEDDLQDAYNDGGYPRMFWIILTSLLTLTVEIIDTHQKKFLNETIKHRIGD